MPKRVLTSVAVACQKSIALLRAAQDVATGKEWRRLQHAISRIALTAGKITPVIKRTRKPKKKAAAT